MKERPIIFNGPMVRAILDGRKVQTRRVVKPQPSGERAVALPDGWGFDMVTDPRLIEPSVTTPMQLHGVIRCPYGQLGDRLWMREKLDGTFGCDAIYRADGERLVDALGWDIWYKDNRSLPCRIIPSIHMPRWASRITLEITGVRVERLQEISEADAVAEGIKRWIPRSDSPVIYDERGKYRPLFGADYDRDRVADGPRSARDAFAALWDGINGKKYPWSSNPWIWVVSFSRIEP